MPENAPTAPVCDARLMCAEGEVRMWYGDLNRAAEYYAEFYALLSEDERRRAAQFNEARQRGFFVAGRGLLREILGRYVNLAGGDLRFCYGPRGKPLLLDDDGGSPVYFNLAHSGGHWVLAVTAIGEIGVDIERPRADLDLEKMARYICTPRERAAWRGLPAAQRPGNLLRCWTRKEAYLKASGLGLAQRLNELDVSGERPRVAGDETRRRWSLHDFEFAGGGVGALAVAGPVEFIHHEEWKKEVARRDGLV